MYTVGLTGSIGSGKSTVSKIVKGRGIYVIDTDEISRTLTADDSPILSELSEAFGPEILRDDGSLDRKTLARIAFSNLEKKTLLESIVTEKVKEIMWEQSEEYKANGERLIFFDIPLLFENNLLGRFDEVWSVIADTETRFMRAHERDGISREDFDARDKVQFHQEEKRKHSDVVFDNDGTKEELIIRVNIELDRVSELSGFGLL